MKNICINAFSTFVIATSFASEIGGTQKVHLNEVLEHIADGGPPAQIAVVLPYASRSGENSEAQELLDALFAQAADDTLIAIFDGATGRRLSTVIIPRNKNVVGRDKEINAQLGGVQTFFAKPHETRSGKSAIVNVPEIVSVIADQINGDGADSRLIFVGSPYSYPGEEPVDYGNDQFCWNVGQVLSDGHGMARPEVSPWGTAGRQNELKGLCVDFVCTNPRGTSRTLDPVERFYANYFSGLGAELSTFTTDPTVAATNALTGFRSTKTYDPWNELDSELRVWDLNDRNEAEKRWKGTPPIAAVFMVDGTPSMSSYQKPFCEVGAGAVELMARTAPETSLALTVFSQPGSFTTMPMTPIGEANSWSPATGLEMVQTFLGDKAFRNGGSTADVEGVLLDAISKLESAKADRWVLWLVLDTGPYEMDNDQGISASDNAAEARCKERLTAFVREHNDTRIVITYLGSAEGPIGKRSLSFCHDIVGLGSRHSIVTRSFDGIEAVLSRAAIAD